MQHRLVITLGSNTDAVRHIAYARIALKAYLAGIRIYRCGYTSPIDFPYPSGDFLNLVLTGDTNRSLEEVKHFLSSLELACGRTPQMTLLHPELIPLDADLIAYDTQILKPQDLCRTYLRHGLEALGRLDLLEP